MVSELTRQAVEAGALAIRFARIGACSVTIGQEHPNIGRKLCLAHLSTYIPDFLGGSRCEKSVTDRQEEWLSAEYWGVVKTINGCTLEQIVEVARAAEIGRVMSAINNTARTGTPILADDYVRFDVSAFFTAIANEGIAKGAHGCDACGHRHPGTSEHGSDRIPSWFNDHARFSLGPVSHYADCASRTKRLRLRCNCGAENGREFQIPPLVIEGESR